MPSLLVHTMVSIVPGLFQFSSPGTFGLVKSWDFLASGPSWSVLGPMPSCPGTSREGIALLESLVHTLSFSMSIRNFTTNITLCIGPPDSGTKVFAEKLRPSRKKKGGSCILYACLAIVYCFSYTNWKDTLHFCN